MSAIQVPSSDLISQLETATVETCEAETAAVAALREKYTQYARHNGYVRTAYYTRSGNNYSIERSEYWRGANGKKEKALLVCDDFSEMAESSTDGRYVGRRLYLLASGAWCELRRAGEWSRWQGAPNHWGCAAFAGPPEDEGDEIEGRDDGYAQTRTDAEVAGSWDLGDITDGLAKALAEMCAKLPDRYGKLRTRAERARQIIEGLKNVEGA